MCREITSEPGFTYQDAAAATIDELVSIFEMGELTQLLADAEKARTEALGLVDYYNDASISSGGPNAQKFLRQLSLINLDKVSEARTAFAHILAAINKSIR